jgi:bile acid:Na+ symporter, BASS family
MLNKLRGYMMPMAMIIGAIFHSFFGYFTFLTPYLIFLMLLLTFSNLDFSKIKFSVLHLWLIVFQVAGCILIYNTVKFVNITLAEAMMICVIVPTGTAAAVVTAMLGGNVESLTAYTLLCNFVVAIVAPVIFSFIGNNTVLPFWDSFFAIGNRVGLLLVLPFVLSFIIKKVNVEWSQKIGAYASMSFYIWTLGLLIVTGKTVQFVLAQGTSNKWLEVLVAMGALVVCVVQFITGRRLGRLYDDTVAGGQGLGQKNTILAIWMAQLYLNPIASIGPGSYVLWQNIINSYQVWQKRKTLN